MKKFMLLSDEKLEKIIQSRITEYSREHDRLYESELLTKQMELATLQAQINPHFLYNTLECIRGEAIKYGVGEISEITLALSQFFRYGISSKQNVATLQEELDSVTNYMKIQQYRFKERFHLNVMCGGVSAEALETVMPKLSLQPIVENAINHAFKHKKKDAKIDIEVVETKRHINMTISDNGTGMDEKTLARVRSGTPANAETAGGTGIAVNNVDKRLKLMFGEEYGLYIESVEGEGTDVYIHIPKAPESLK